MTMLTTPSPDTLPDPSGHLPADFKIADISEPVQPAVLQPEGLVVIQASSESENKLLTDLLHTPEQASESNIFQNMGSVALNGELPKWMTAKFLPHREWPDGTPRYPEFIDSPVPLKSLPGYQETKYSRRISKMTDAEVVALADAAPEPTPDTTPDNPWGLTIPDHLLSASATQPKPKIERPVIYAESLFPEDKDSKPKFDIVKIDNSHANYTKTHKRVSQRFDPPLSAKPPQSSHITTAPTYGSEHVFIPTYIHSKEHVGAPSDKKITADDLKQAPASGLRDRFASWLDARGKGSRQEADEVAATPKLTRTEKRSLKAVDHAEKSLGKAAEARAEARAGFEDFDKAQSAHKTWKEQASLSPRKIERASRKLGRQMGKVVKQSKKAEHMTIEAQGKRALLDGERSENYDEKLDALLAAVETVKETPDGWAGSVEKILAGNPKLNTEYETIMAEITADDSKESVTWENIRNLAIERGLSDAQINALSSQYSADAMVQTMFDAEQRLLEQDMPGASITEPVAAAVENNPTKPQPQTPREQEFYSEMADRLLQSEGSSDAHEDYVKLVVNRLMKEPALSHEYDLAKAEIEADGSPRMRIWQNLREAAQARGLSTGDFEKLARRESADVVTKALKTAEARMAAKWGKPSN